MSNEPTSVARSAWLVRLAVCLAASVLTLAVFAGPVFASANNGPSSAPVVGVATPFTGSWPGTVVAHEGADQAFTHWWRLPGTMRNGDKLQIAVDNREAGYYGGLSFCLVGPVDDFGAERALDACAFRNHVERGSQDRFRMTYSGSSGAAFLVIGIGCCGDVGDVADGGDYGQYTLTIERLITKINVGLRVPSVLPPQVSLSANLVYGDNTAVADGSAATLQWRPLAPKGAKAKPFTSLAETTSTGGVASFNVLMPAAAQGRKIQLRACALQPGSSSFHCSTSSRSKIAATPCSKALANRRALSRKVNRLGRKVLRTHGREKRRAKRSLKKSKKKLEKAKRAVRGRCA